MSNNIIENKQQRPDYRHLIIDNPGSIQKVRYKGA